MCTCHSKTVKLVDLKTAEIFCAVHGRREIYRSDKGVWESGPVRMARMIRHHVCVKCKTVFHDFMDWERDREFCDKCVDKKETANNHRQALIRQAKVVIARKNGKGSSWHIGTRQNNGEVGR